MKKIIIALAAVAALASCAKSEVEYAQTGEIGIAPVPQNMTKTMMTGEVFQTTEKFNVWAWYKQLDAATTIAEWQASDKQQQLYIPEKPFTFRSGSDWGGVTPYYWPKLGSLLFAGYYPAALEENTEVEVDYTFDASNNKMVFTGVNQGTVGTVAGEYDEDIMYFNMTATSYDKNTVEVVFKHALSWITVNVKKSAENPKIVVDDIRFTGVNNQGTGTVDGASVIDWDLTGDPNPTVFATALELDVENSNLTEHLFIPQEMAGDLVITYTVYSSDTEKFTEVYTAALSSLKDDLDTWEPAKHYIYNIEIGTSEILIAPTVENWTEVAVPVTVQ